MFLTVISWLKQHELPCMFKKILHTECPGCGFQRSAVSLLEGKFSESFHYYPALMPLILLIAFVWLSSKYNIRFSAIIIKTGIVFIFLIILANYIFKLTTTKVYD